MSISKADPCHPSSEQFSSERANPERFTPEHGGNLQAASDFYGIPVAQWLDLSTGMNPNPYPVAPLPPEVFQQLPYLRNDFMQAAKGYYLGAEQTTSLLAIPGSQWAIQQLPTLLPKYPVLVPQLGYQEHGKQWRKSHPVVTYPDLNSADQITAIDDALAESSAQHVVIINPNNPTGTRVSTEQLLLWAETLAEGAYLVVDEAFMDLTPTLSLLPNQLPDNVIVLRSFGKFFGLAGLRLGFVFGAEAVIDQLNDQLGLWQISGPAQAIAVQALNDQVWQQQARDHIEQCAQATHQWAINEGIAIHGQPLAKAGLFTSWLMPANEAQSLVANMAQRGILLRLITVDADYSIVRLGLIPK